MDNIDVLLLEAFHICERGRRVTDTGPLPLSIRDVTDYLEAFPTCLDNLTFYRAIFALDNMCLENHYDNNKPKVKKTSGQSTPL